MVTGVSHDAVAQPANPDDLVDLAGDGALAFVACLVHDAVVEAARGDATPGYGWSAALVAGCVRSGRPG